MPRLDNTNQSILAFLRVFGTKEVSNIQYTPDSPDATPEVDVCADCLKGFFKLGIETKDHPPYTEENFCCMCGKTMEREE